jgi:tape measure domain-containing protein
MEIERLMVKLAADASQYLKVFDVAETRLISYSAAVTGLISTMAAKLAAEYEKAAIAFEVMTGSASVGKKLIEDLVQMAVETPFHSTELIAAGKQLKAFGFNAQEILPTLHALGETASGTGTPLWRIVLAFGQVRTAGRLLGQELRQFTNAGIPMAEMLAAVMNKPVETIRKLVREGNVGFREVAMAFNKMTQEGGMYSGLMERINKETVAGRWENFTENLQVAARNFGLAAFEGLGLKDVISSMTDATKDFTNNKDAVVEFFRRLKAGVKDVYDFLKPVFEWVKQNEELITTILKVGGALVLFGGILKITTLLFKFMVFTGMGLIGILHPLALLGAAFLILPVVIGPAKAVLGGLVEIVESGIKAIGEWITRNQDWIFKIAAVTIGYVTLGAGVAAFILIVVKGIAIVTAFWVAFTSPISVALLALTSITVILGQLGALDGIGENLAKGFKNFSVVAQDAISGVAAAIREGDIAGAFDILYKTIQYGWKVLMVSLRAEWMRFSANMSVEIGGNLEMGVTGKLAVAKKWLTIMRESAAQGGGRLPEQRLQEIEKEYQQNIKFDLDKFNAEKTARNFAVEKNIEKMFQDLERDPLRGKIEEMSRFAREPLGKEMRDLMRRYEVTEVPFRGVGPEQELGLMGLGVTGPVAAGLKQAAVSDAISAIEAYHEALRTGANDIGKWRDAAVAAVKVAEEFNKVTEQGAKMDYGKIFVPFAISPKARELAERLDLQYQKGVGIYDFFLTRGKQYQEAFLGGGPGERALMSVVGGAGVAGVPGLGVKGILDRPEYRYGLSMDAFKELRKAVGEPTDKLPPLALEGTREAQEIINRNQGQNLSVAQETLKVIREARYIQERTMEYNKQVADVLEAFFGTPEVQHWGGGGDWS